MAHAFEAGKVERSAWLVFFPLTNHAERNF